MALRNPVETVRFKQHIDRLLAEILRRRFQVHGRMTTWPRIGALSAHLEPPGIGQPVPSEGETGEAFEIESSSAMKASREEACKTFIH